MHSPKQTARSKSQEWLLQATLASPSLYPLVCTTTPSPHRQFKLAEQFHCSLGPYWIP